MCISDLLGRDRDGEEGAFREMSSSQGASGGLGLGQTLHVCLRCICSCAEMTSQSAGPTGKCNLTDLRKKKCSEKTELGGW